jgi:sulfur-oxidizing protein SoxX
MSSARRWAGWGAPLALGAGLVAGLVAGEVAGEAAAQAPRQEPLPYQVVGTAIPASLTGKPGDPVRGRAIVVDRTRGLCLLCHPGPFPDQPFQGNLSPDLTGVGARLNSGELRLRIVDGHVLNPDTIMPSYYRVDGLTRVGAAFKGRTLLDAAEIEDVVAFLGTLGQEGPPP